MFLLLKTSNISIDISDELAGSDKRLRIKGNRFFKSKVWMIRLSIFGLMSINDNINSLKSLLL